MTFLYLFILILCIYIIALIIGKISKTKSKIELFILVVFIIFPLFFILLFSSMLSQKWIVEERINIKEKVEYYIIKCDRNNDHNISLSNPDESSFKEGKYTVYIAWFLNRADINHDSTCTSIELENEMKRFDANNDGLLAKKQSGINELRKAPFINEYENFDMNKIK